jgi:hypothetical protein
MKNKEQESNSASLNSITLIKNTDNINYYRNLKDMHNQYNSICEKKTIKYCIISLVAPLIIFSVMFGMLPVTMETLLWILGTSCALGIVTLVVIDTKKPTFFVKALKSFFDKLEDNFNNNIVKKAKKKNIHLDKDVCVSYSNYETIKKKVASLLEVAETAINKYDLVINNQIVYPQDTKKYNYDEIRSYLNQQLELLESNPNAYDQVKDSSKVLPIIDKKVDCIQSSERIIQAPCSEQQEVLSDGEFVKKK